MSTRPRLVIVSGPPAAGKTTLVQTLSEKLEIPHFSRDEFKETMLTLLGADDRGESEELGRVSLAMLCQVAERLLSNGIGVVIESNFRRGKEEGALRPLLKLAEGFQIHCTADDKEIEDRYIERFKKGERHPGHFDKEGVPRLRADLARDAYASLELNIPTIDVDTADGYKPSLEEVVAFVTGE